MKIIDLLNKIANGDELPEKIKYDEIIWKLNQSNKTYDNGGSCLFEDYIDVRYVITDILNDEVEIIEEDKKIEKLNENTFGNNRTFDEVDSDIDFVVEKVNEIIDKINEVKNE